MIGKLRTPDPRKGKLIQFAGRSGINRKRQSVLLTGSARTLYNISNTKTFICKING